MSERPDCAHRGEHFDLDNPWLICDDCGQIRDALTGAVMKEADHA